MAVADLEEACFFHISNRQELMVVCMDLDASILPIAFLSLRIRPVFVSAKVTRIPFDYADTF